MNYLTQFRESIDNPESFWKRQSEKIDWFKAPKTILSQDENGFYRWFSGGRLNTCHLALDIHVAKGRGNQPALIYDSPVTETKRSYSYTELLDETSRFSGVLKNLGVVKGDRVVIYMPMVPELPVTMLACARIGAVHSVVFGGFSADSLADRIADSTCTTLVTCNGTHRGDKP